MDKVIEGALWWRSGHLLGPQTSALVRLVQEIYLQSFEIRLLQRKEKEIDSLLKLHLALIEVGLTEGQSIQDAINFIFLESTQQPSKPIQEQKDVKSRLHQNNIQRQCLQDIQSQKLPISSEEDNQLHFLLSLEDLKVHRFDEGLATVDEESDLHQWGEQIFSTLADTRRKREVFRAGNSWDKIQKSRKYHTSAIMHLWCLLPDGISAVQKIVYWNHG